MSGERLYVRAAPGRSVFVGYVADAERVVRHQAGALGDRLFQQARRSRARPEIEGACAALCHRLPRGARR